MKIFAGLFLFLSLSAFAQDLRSTATQELAAPSRTGARVKTADTNYLSAEQTSVILQLEDTYQEPRLRDFEWNLGFFLQSHSPHGQVNTNTNSEDLGKSGTTILPSLSFGPLYNFSEGHAGALQLGLEGEAGFTSQKVSLTNASNQTVDARLDTTLTEMRALARWGASFGGTLHGRIGYGLGRMNFNQTSNNSLVRWNAGGDYTAILLGADYKVDHRWAAIAQVKILAKRGGWPAEVELPSSPLEVGAQLLW